MLWCCCVALCLSTVITTATVSNATPAYNVYFNNCLITRLGKPIAPTLTSLV